MHHKLNTQSGFSLIELVVAMAIAGILLGVGVPSFKSFIASSKMTEVNNALVYSIQLARSASVERLEPVGLCVSDDPMASEAVCTTGGNYNKGWFVYADANGDGDRDSGEDILERVEPPGELFEFDPSSSYENHIYFSDSGASINVAGVPVKGSIGIDYSNETELRLIRVSANGRVTTETP